jgi:hypothetical protein
MTTSFDFQSSRSPSSSLDPSSWKKVLLMWQETEKLLRSIHPSCISFYSKPDEEFASTSFSNTSSYGTSFRGGCGLPLEFFLLTPKRDIYYFRGNKRFILQLLDQSVNLRIGRFSSKLQSTLMSFIEMAELPYFTVASPQLQNLPADLFEYHSFCNSFFLHDFFNSSSRSVLLEKVIFKVMSRVLFILREVTHRIPKLIIYLKGRNFPTLKDGTDSVKCTFMANFPFPDFHIQWKDSTRIFYSLEHGEVHIVRRNKKLGNQSWKGFFNDHLVHVNPTLRPYLVDCSGISEKCLVEWKRQQSLGSSGSSGSSSPPIVFIHD